MTASAPDLACVRLGSLADYQRFQRERAGALAGQRAHERALAVAGEAFEVTAWCHPCAALHPMRCDWRWSYLAEGELVPNWREHLVCPQCGLNNRMRATIQLIEQVSSTPATRVYLTEQLTPIYRYLAPRCPGLVGSEYLGAYVAPGAVDERGLRHQDLTRLSFADASFDLVVSLDVLEHVPGYRDALGECRRVLAPGGLLLLTVPFLPERATNLVRARRRADGTVEHLEPPEYHYDPLSPDGCLAYYQFGWELLEALREAGFTAAEALHYWSAELGYLGRDQLAFVARRED